MARQNVPPLADYLLVSKSTESLISGHFVDRYGLILGEFVSEYELPADQYTTLAEVAGGSIPDGAVGFIVAIVTQNTVILAAESGTTPPAYGGAQANCYYHAADTRGIVLGQA